MLSDVLRVVLVLLAFGLPILAWVRWPHAREAVTGVAFGLGFVIGFLGFMLDPIGLPDPACNPSSLPFGQRVVDALFGTIQLVVLGVDADQTRTWLLSVARVLMPMAVAQGLIIVLARLGNWQLRVWLMLCPPTTLVLGCGQKGARLARFYAQLDTDNGERSWYRPGVVVVDRKQQALDAAAFAGFAVERLHTSPDADDILVATRAARAKRVVICTGDDSHDYALLKRLCAHLKSRGEKAGAPEIIVSVDSEAIDRAALFDAELRERRPHLLNVPRLEARCLLQTWPPHAVVPFVGSGEDTNRFQAGRDNPCHVAIVGEGKLVEELAAHAVRALVYDPNTPIRVTVLTPRAFDMRRRFFTRYPALSPSASRDQAECYGQQLPLAIVTFAETEVAPINANALIAAHVRQRIDVIYVVGGSDDRTLALSAEALKVADVLPDEKPGVVICRDLPTPATEPGGHDAPASSELGTGRVALHGFDLNSWQARRPDREHPEDAWDGFAIPLWEIYEKAYSSQSSKPLGLKGWRTEPHDKQWWNRCSGDHSALKVMLLARGREIPEESRIREVLNPEALLELAAPREPETMLVWFQKLEHRRYVRERLVDGWLRRPGKRSSDPERDIEKRNDFLLNPTLKPFAKLDEDEKMKDRIIVQAMTQARKELLRRQGA